MLDGATLVKRIRAAYDWTQQQVANAVKTDVRNVGRWERGEYQPRYNYHVRLQRILDKAPNWKSLRKKRGA